MKKILLIFVLMASLLLTAEVQPRGLTCRELAEPAQPTGMQAKTWSGMHQTLPRQSETDRLSREGWELADSVKINSFVSAGSAIEVEFNSFSQQIIVSGNNSGLCAAALNAVERAPRWIEAELSTTLALLDEEHQQLWAEVINDVDDPIVDEVAFCIATASDVYLQSEWAYPELYIRNAELIYQYDNELNYVEVVDYGNSLTDDDYYSTTRYWSKTADGAVHQVEVPKDVYYWHIVHPKITDEIPAFIHPDITESNSTHDNNISDPESGYFWREFLYSYADEGYPLLRTYLMQCSYANDFTTGYDSAIGACTQWLAQSLQFTSNFERPHQPVRIYRKHIGRCGEHADMRVAIGRIALIPMTSIVCFTVDHTWNEFWDEEWIHWDGSSINNYYMYENGWGSNFGSVIDVRSDGLMTPVTHKYAPNYADLTVHVTDAAGLPVDGARVIIGLWLNGQISGDMVGWTDNEGTYHFPIGDGHQYWAAVSSSLGSLDYQQFAENTAGGDVYDIELQLDGSISQLDYSQIDMPLDDFEDYRLVVDFQADDQVIYGNIVMDDTSENTWFYQRRDTGAVNCFMFDMVHYFSYVAGVPFDAFNAITNTDFGYYDFPMPTPDLGSWHAVIDNSDNVTNPQHVTGSISLYRWEGTGGSAEINGVVCDAANGLPVAAATVTARGFSTATDENGLFNLQVYPGIYDIVVDHEFYETIRYTDIELADGDEYELNSSLSDDPIKPLDVIVIADDETNAQISWESPHSLLPDRSLLGYSVYRLLAEDLDVFDNWVELTPDIISDTSYLDEEWLDQEQGEYYYAVCAVYDQLSSDFALSEIVPLQMTGFFTLTLETNANESAAGAVVRMVNNEGYNTPYIYEGVYPQEGNLNFPAVRIGEYDLTIELDFFQLHNIPNYYHTGDTYYTAELIELKPMPTFPGVCDYYLSWDPVPRNRELLGYTVHVDGTSLEGTVQNPGLDLQAAGVDDGLHTVGVKAHYTTGTTDYAEVQIINGSSLEYEQLASFDFDNDFTDSVNGWTGTSETVQLVASPFGNGAEFNGADFITIPANEQLTASALHYTTAFWIYADTLNTSWRGVMGRPGRNQCCWLKSTEGYVHHRFHTEDGGTNDGAPNTPDGSFHWLEWNMVAIVNDGATAKTYINGVLSAISELSSPLVADSSDMYIGKSPDSPSAEGYLYGVVDEVRLWNRGLSDLELQTLYLNETAVLGTGTLMGSVVEAESGDPMQNVCINAGLAQFFSDAQGHFEIDLPARTYDIKFSYNDYLVQYAEDVQIIADEVSIVDFSFELTDLDDNALPAAHLLSVKNYPNPLTAASLRSGGTHILMNWMGSSSAEAAVTIYNIKGRKVNEAHLALIPGNNIYQWDGKNHYRGLCASGVYFYKVTAQDITATGKMLLVR